MRNQRNSGQSFTVPEIDEAKDGGGVFKTHFKVVHQKDLSKRHLHLYKKVEKPTDEKH